MPLGALADNVLLVIALVALASGALRLSATLVPTGLPRVISAVVFTAAAAVIEALALGLFGLSGTPAALTGLAVITWLVLWRACPTPRCSLLGEAVDALSELDLSAQLALGATGGALVAVAAIELHRPVLGQDAVTYHLPEVIGFVQSGHAGRVLNDFYGLPVGNYPITEEVLLAWATGISHGFSALILATLATVPLLLAAGWSGLRALGVNRAVTALALAALALVPLVLEAWTQPGTDLQAFTWLACAAALCLAARQRPALLAPAVIAGGLGIGTKTTVVTWVIVLLLVTAWYNRRTLGAHARTLLGAAVIAVLAGLLWYLRNWIDHGSPLWPFSSFPGGDPRPELIDYLATSLLQSVDRTLLQHLNAYAAALSGGVVLALGGITVVFLGAMARRGRLVVAGGVVLLGTLEYAAGPVTGLPPHGEELVGVIGSTLRYLMPVFGAGVVALALLGSDRRRTLAALGLLGLAGALVWDIVSDASADFHLPSDSWLWPGIVLGAAVVPALAWVLPRARSGRSRLSAAGTQVAAGLLAAVILAAGATHFSYRNAATKDFAAPIEAFLLTQPAYLHTHFPVATSGTGLAPLAGDRLQHRITVIPQHASCARVVGDRVEGWVVVELPQPDTRSGLLAHVVENGTAAGCLSGDRPAFDDGRYAVYAPLAQWWSYAPLSSIQYSPNPPGQTS